MSEGKEKLAVEDKDLKLVFKIIELKDMMTPQNSGLTKEMLEGAGRKLYEFISDYWSKYRDIPTKTTIDGLLASSDLKMFPVVEPLDFLIDEILDRHVHAKNMEYIFAYEGLVKRLPPRQVPLEAEAMLRKQLDFNSGKLKIVNAGDLVDEILQDYEDAGKGILGIPTPWKTMSEATNGWMPGDLSFVVARTGQGKTWTFIKILDAAIKSKKKASEEFNNVLVFSGEMAEKDIVKRHVALELQIPYGLFRKGKLDAVNEKKFKEGVEKYRDEKRLKVIDASGGINTAEIESNIYKVNPDLVLIDAFYRIKSVARAKDRFENLALATEESKKICGRCKVPIIGTTQLNRDSTKKKTIGTEDLAMTDVLTWEATNVFAMSQDQDLKTGFKMSFIPVKVREGENQGKKIYTNWDFFRMNFDEISEFEATMATQANTLPKEEHF